MYEVNDKGGICLEDSAYAVHPDRKGEVHKYSEGNDGNNEII